MIRSSRLLHGSSRVLVSRTRLRFRGLFLCCLGATLALVPLGCARSGDTLIGTGWAWPLPPPSMRTEAFAERARTAADQIRLSNAFAWANQEATGRGSASLDRSLTDPTVADLLRRAQAREAARRHLAERIAALPYASGGVTSGPAPRLGDPGRLTLQQSRRLSDLIARSPVQGEALRDDGRVEVLVALPLDNVARILLDEPIPESAWKPESTGSAATPVPRDSTTSATVAASQNDPRPGVRRSLPAVGDLEFFAAVAHESETTAAPSTVLPSEKAIESDPTHPLGFIPDAESRYEAQRRAEALARQWLWDNLQARTLESGRTVSQGITTFSSLRSIAMKQVENAPVRSVFWDDLGRCRVTVELDWKAFLKEFLSTQKEESPGRRPSPMSPN